VTFRYVFREQAVLKEDSGRNQDLKKAHVKPESVDRVGGIERSSIGTL